MASITKNFIHSSILTTANYIFPLITYPYVSRVLGVDNIGLYNFIDSIINYFCLFATLGIGIVGIREVAAVSANRNKLSDTFSRLLSLNLIATAIALVILFVATFTVPTLRQHYELMTFGAFKLLFNTLLVEWLYKGLEDFRYITRRTIFVRALFIIAVFIFVRKRSDYGIYYLLTVSMYVVNAIINMVHSRRFASIKLTFHNLKPFLRPTLTLGLYSILTSMYTTFNIMFLGFVTNDTQVGFYTTATKLYTIILALYTAFTGVMLPRMSILVAENRIEEFLNLIRRSTDILYTVSIPMVIYTLIFAPQIVGVISGMGYEGAILPMRIIIPLIMIVGYEQITVVQALTPLKQDKTLLRNSLIGAIVGVSLNILLVPSMMAIGSSIVWVTSEITILILSQIALSRVINHRFDFRLLAIRIGRYLPLAVILIAINSCIDRYLYTLIVGGVALLIYFVALNAFIIKDGECRSLITRLTKRTP